MRIAADDDCTLEAAGIIQEGTTIYLTDRSMVQGKTKLAES